MSVLLTAVDLCRIMYAAWPDNDNICLESTSLNPKDFQKVLLISITIFISSYLHFFYKHKLFEDLCHSRSRLFTTKYYVTKRKSLQCFDQRISRAFPGRQFTYIFNNFRLSKLQERMNKNKAKRNSHVDQKSAEIKLAPFSVVGKLPFLKAHSTG